MGVYPQPVADSLRRGRAVSSWLLPRLLHPPPHRLRAAIHSYARGIVEKDSFEDANTVEERPHCGRPFDEGYKFCRKYPVWNVLEKGTRNLARGAWRCTPCTRLYLIPTRCAPLPFTLINTQQLLCTTCFSGGADKKKANRQKTEERGRNRTFEYGERAKSVVLVTDRSGYLGRNELNYPNKKLREVL